MSSEEILCDDCSTEPAAMETTIVALTDAAAPSPGSPRAQCPACLAELVQEGDRRGWTVSGSLLVYPRDPVGHLAALLDAVGLVHHSGYRLEGDELVALVLDRPQHPVVLAQNNGELWLLAEVGVEGHGVYPEDDLEDELEAPLPAAHLLWWDDNQERAVLARALGRAISAEAFKDATRAFGQLASDVEKRLTSLEDLALQRSSSAEDLSDCVLMPPRAS